MRSEYLRGFRKYDVVVIHRVHGRFVDTFWARTSVEALAAAAKKWRGSTVMSQVRVREV